MTTKRMQNILKNYDPVMALHRAMRSHQWRIWKVKRGLEYHGERKRSWWRSELYCECGTRKFQVRDSLGRRVWTRYAHPDGYRLADLGLTESEINSLLWLVVMERELGRQGVSEIQEIIGERKASENQ